MLFAGSTAFELGPGPVADRFMLRNQSFRFGLTSHILRCSLSSRELHMRNDMNFFVNALCVAL